MLQLFTLIVSAFVVFATESKEEMTKLLVCLAKEEEQIHKSKTSGPVYELNQTFMNEFSTVNRIDLKEDYYKNICLNPNYSPSIALLRLLILRDKNAFIAKNNLDKYAIQTLIDTAPELFVRYIGGLQLITKDAHCLTNEVPEISRFYQSYKALEGEMPTSQILDQSKDLPVILKRINEFDSIFKKCQKLKVNNTKKAVNAADL